MLSELEQHRIANEVDPKAAGFFRKSLMNAANKEAEAMMKSLLPLAVEFGFKARERNINLERALMEAIDGAKCDGCDAGCKWCMTMLPYRPRGG